MEEQTAQEVINALGAISKARYLAMDKDGEWWAYVRKPVISKPVIRARSWMVWDKGTWPIGIFFNIQPTEDWKKSLVEYQPEKL